MIRFIIFFLLLFLPANIRAEVKIIELQHRAPAEIVEQVREILDTGEKVQVAGSFLVIIANDESLTAAEKLIAVLDRQPIQLIVRIRHQERLQQVAERVGGTVYSGTENHLSAKGSAVRRLGSSRTYLEQSLRVQEGAQGWLEIGRDIPYTKEWAVLTGDVRGYSEKIAYNNVTTGFYVCPIQVVGEKVLVAIEPRIEAVPSYREGYPPPVDFSRYRSRFYLPLGEWIELGSQLQQGDQLGRAIIFWSSKDDHADKILFVRIDRAEGFSP